MHLSQGLETSGISCNTAIWCNDNNGKSSIAYKLITPKMSDLEPDLEPDLESNHVVLYKINISRIF